MRKENIFNRINQMSAEELSSLVCEALDESGIPYKIGVSNIKFPKLKQHQYFTKEKDIMAKHVNIGQLHTFLTPYSGKSIDTGKWVYGFYHCRNYVWYGKPICRHYILPYMAEDSIVIDPATLRVATGMSSCKDVGIFSGDVILDRDAQLQGVVLYNEQEGKFVLHTVTDEVFDFSECFSTDFEIVGNIFDNPEMNCAQKEHSILLGKYAYDLANNPYTREKYPDLYAAVSTQLRFVCHEKLPTYVVFLSGDAWMQYLRYTGDADTPFIPDPTDPDAFKVVAVDVEPNENFTGASLMHRYLVSTPGVSFKRGDYGEALLNIEGKWYTYHHWHTEVKDNKTVVTLYLQELPDCRLP